MFVSASFFTILILYFTVSGLSYFTNTIVGILSIVVTSICISSVLIGSINFIFPFESICDLISINSSESSSLYPSGACVSFIYIGSKSVFNLFVLYDNVFEYPDSSVTSSPFNVVLSPVYTLNFAFDK